MPCHFAVSDVRFDNEAAAIRERGGQVWRVVRPGQGYIAGEHASEVGVSESLIDLTLENAGEKAGLCAGVNEAWRRLQEATMEAVS